jgi:hypothetical protein
LAKKNADPQGSPLAATFVSRVASSLELLQHSLVVRPEARG